MPDVLHLDIELRFYLKPAWAGRPSSDAPKTAYRGRMRRIFVFLAAGVLILAILWSSEQRPLDSPKRGEASFAPAPAGDPLNTVTGKGDGPRTPRPEVAIVSLVIDGDTVRLSDGRVLRYIGIDAPEAGSRDRPVECLAEAATARNRALVEGREVRLERDVSETDAYGRLLRYLFVNGLLINEVLVREGFARSATFPPDLKYQDILRNAERAARLATRGIFGERCRGSRPRPAED